jgi:transcriptional regulator GlxA family with amidase domain
VRTAIFVYDGFQGLDVVGPLEVLHCARALREQSGGELPSYEPVTVGPSRAPVRSESGLQIVPELALDEVGEVHTLLVPGGQGIAQRLTEPALVQGLRGLAARSTRLVSVCTGAFLLAGCGLLDGRRATTHWAYCDALQQLFPQVSVQRDVIFVRDEGVWTSAGVTAGMDVALALLEEDHGPELAQQVARWLVLFVRRAGGQPQVSAQLASQAADRPPVRALVDYIVEHPEADLAIPALARRCGMSVRNFARVFRAETGLSPARFVAQVRLDTARRLLEASDGNIDQVARRSGFGTAEALRRAFARALGKSPRAYRQQS